MNYTFKDYKNKISIIEVAKSLGYELEKSKGVSAEYEVYYLREGGNVSDIIVVHYPNDTFGQLYKSPTMGDEGDLITFVINRLHKFGACYKGWDGVNEVLTGFMGDVYQAKRQENSQSEVKRVKPFNIAEFDVQKATLRDLDVLRYRGLSDEIINLFLPHICIVTDLLSTYKMQNLGFPYYDVPGGKRIINFEVRNKIINKTYKGHARSGEKANGVWSVSWNPNPEQIKKCFFFEAAIDAMSFVQLFYGRLNLNEIAVNSTGGQVSSRQIINTCAHYKNAEKFNCYDNDPQGHIFDVQTNAILKGERFKFQNRMITKEFITEYNGTKQTWKYEDFSVDAFCKATGFQPVCYSLKIPHPYKDFNEPLQKNEAFKIDANFVWPV